MTLDQIKQEAEKAYPDTKSLYDIVLTLDEVIRFAKHCVDKATAWRPIETAPNDCQEILVWGKHLAYPFSVHRKSSGAWVSAGDVLLTEVHLSHWQPLPPAPEAA